MAETHLTQDAFDRLTAELEDLKTRGRVEIARAIEAARALGDLSENGDYHAAKDSQGKMEARIRQLEAMLSDAVIVVESLRRASMSRSTGGIQPVRFEAPVMASSWDAGRWPSAAATSSAPNVPSRPHST